jgi:repressor LexA
MEIFQYLRSFIETHGYPPTVREIGADFGMKSPSTIYFHLKKLAEAGLIDMPPGKTRAITLLQDPVPSRDQIPVVDHVTADSPVPTEETMEDYVAFHGTGRREEYFALRVQGDAMKGAGILPGDLVVVHRQEDAENGQLVVVLVEGEAAVRTLSIKNRHIWLLPANPAYPPIDGTDLPIVGRVEQLIRRY